MAEAFGEYNVRKMYSQLTRHDYFVWLAYFSQKESILEHRKKTIEAGGATKVFEPPVPKDKFELLRDFLESGHVVADA